MFGAQGSDSARTFEDNLDALGSWRGPVAGGEGEGESQVRGGTEGFEMGGGAKRFLSTPRRNKEEAARGCSRNLGMQLVFSMVSDCCAKVRLHGAGEEKGPWLGGYCNGSLVERERKD